MPPSTLLEMNLPRNEGAYDMSFSLLAAGAAAESSVQVVVVCPKGRDRDTEPFAVVEGVEIHRFPLQPATRTSGRIPRAPFLLGIKSS